MNDDDLKASWAEIKDPKEMLRALIANWQFIGSDSYYRDLCDALYDNAVRVAQ